MKKLLLSAFLGLSAALMTPALSQAGTFGLFTGCGLFGCCGCSRCNFTIRQYNAFTPVCSGNVTCLGCSPFASPYGGGLNYYGPMTGPCGTCYGGGQAFGQLPYSTMPEEYAMPESQVTPLPQPTVVTSPAATSMTPNMSGMMQAGYYPAYAPLYNPYPAYSYYAPMYYSTAK